MSDGHRARRAAARRGEDAVRHLQLPGRVRRARAHAAARCCRTSRCSFSTPCITSPQTYRVSRRTGGAMGAEPRHAAGGRTSAGTVAAGHQGVLRQAQGRAALRGARGLRRLVHRPPARAVGVARRARGSRAVPAAQWHRPAKGQPARRMVDQRGVGVRQGPRHPAPARSTTSATRASAANHARRCRSIPATIARAAGRARSWSAGFTFSRSDLRPLHHARPSRIQSR